MTASAAVRGRSDTPGGTSSICRKKCDSIGYYLSPDNDYLRSIFTGEPPVFESLVRNYRRGGNAMGVPGNVGPRGGYRTSRENNSDEL